MNSHPATPSSSELHSANNPIDQALNPDLNTHLDTATHHTVNTTNSADYGDHGQTEDDALSLQQPLPAQVHHGPEDPGPDPGEEGSGTTTLPINSNSATHRDNATMLTSPTSHPTSVTNGHQNVGTPQDMVAAREMNANQKQSHAYHTSAAVTSLLAVTQTDTPDTVTTQGNVPSVSPSLASSSTGQGSSLQHHMAHVPSPDEKRQVKTPARAAGQSAERGQGHLENKLHPA